jgi:hypothetical protein
MLVVMLSLSVLYRAKFYLTPSDLADFGTSEDIPLEWMLTLYDGHPKKIFPATHPTNFFQLLISLLEMSRIYRELKKLSPQRINTPVKKWAHELSKEFSKEEV